MAKRPSQFFQSRDGDTQPVRTMPEQDETGKGHSGRHSGVPIRRQIDAQDRMVNPQGLPDAIGEGPGGEELLALLMAQLKR